MGFLGAGTIWRTSDTVRGLTTAASIWLVAAIGLLVGTGMYALAVFTTVMSLVTLLALRPARRRARRYGEPSLVPENGEAAEDEE